MRKLFVEFSASKAKAAELAKEAVAKLAEEYAEYLPSKPKVNLDDSGKHRYYVDFGACEPSDEYLDEVETVQIVVLIDFDNDENWIDVAGLMTRFHYNNGKITTYSRSTAEIWDELESDFHEKASVRKTHRSHKLREEKDEYYGDGIENLNKTDVRRLNYSLDVLRQAILEIKDIIS